MRFHKQVLLLLTLAWVAAMNRGVSAVHLCDDVCGGGATCDSECWLTQEDYDNGADPTTCGDQGYSCCGDGICETEEYCGVCPEDCGESDPCADPPQCAYSYQCPSGDVCDPFEECVPGSPNHSGGTTCANKTDCQGNDVCAEEDCSVPKSTTCGGSPGCTSDSDCYNGDPNNPEYCDPGTNRCQYKNSVGCPPF